MNKQARITIPQRAQGGFTLIELIVVIVILGILAATALPRFSNLSADARAASLNAAAGAMRSASAMAHGQALAAGNNPATVLMENVNVAMTNGYPSASAAGIIAAAGLTNTSDYTVIASGAAATSTAPAAGANDVVIQPANGATINCFIRYTASTAVNTPPVVSGTLNAASCP